MLTVAVTKDNREEQDADGRVSVETGWGCI